MATTNPTLPTSAFIGNDDFRWWMGTVLNADDKDAKLGRVKVNILGYHRPKEQPEDLPWALVMAPTDSAGANGVGSAPNSLKPGSFVVGFFLDYPDCQQPVVIGTLLSKIEEVIDPESQKRWDYPGAFENTISKVKSDVTDRGSSEAAVLNAASMSAAAAAAPHSAANPSGVVKEIPIADGKNAGDKTLPSNINYALTNISNTMKYLQGVNLNMTELSVDIDSEVQTIPVSNTEGFPPRGVLDIGGEKIGYNNINQKTFVLAKRGFGGSTPSKHTKGTFVNLITKGEYLGTSAKAGDATGTFVDNLVDVKKVVDDALEFIRDSLWWTVNQVKSFLMSQITQILNAIGLAAISPIPMFGKVLTDVIIVILKQIACILDESLMDALMSGITDAIMEFVNSALGVLDQIQCVVDSVFGAIFQLVELGNQIFGIINDIIGVFNGAGDLKGLGNLQQLNIAGILEFIFGLLNIGCNKDTRDPFSITFSMCDLANLGSCGSGSSPFNIDIRGIPGRYNPEYSKIIGTFSETGTMVLMDDTPYNSRLVIEHGPSKSGIHVYDNGDVRITNSSKKTEVTIKNEEIIVHGDYTVTVDGNYHLKVGKDMHVEVLGMYNLAVNRESKITYAGEHKTFFKNDSRLEANNGLAIVASKLGVSCSGQYEMWSPIMTTYTTEQNHFNTGGWHLLTTFENRFVTANAFMLSGISNTILGAGTNTSIYAGTHFEGTGGAWSGIKLGISNHTTIGSETDFWIAQKTENVFGVDTENKLSLELANTIGAKITNVTGADIETDQGFKAEGTVGLRVTASGGLTLHT
jgi:hypothetical protein